MVIQPDAAAHPAFAEKQSDMGDTQQIPEPPGDTLSGMETVHIDIDGLFSGTETQEQTTPIRFENLELTAEDILSTLSRKPQEKYKFRKSIGQGGMKVVIQVKDRDTTRDIAMAMLPDAQSRPKQEILRFIEEARITASLEHPNIVPVHDIGVDDYGSPYFTMKLIRGETLASVLRKLHDGDPEYLENYPLDKLLRIFLKICNGVAFAHSKGVLHLDLKPENVQLGDYGEVILMDWGLAKLVSVPESDNSAPLDAQVVQQGNRTGDGVRKGTPGYMAPEQAAGKNSQKSFRTDVYSLGAILYSLLTYCNPLEGNDVGKLLTATIRGDVVPPSQRTPERLIPAGLEAVVLKAMAVDPAGRYSGAKELRNEVLAFLSGFATHAERATLWKKAFLLMCRHKITSIAVAVALLLGLGTGIYAAVDYKLQHGDWIPVYDMNFTDSGTSLEKFSFYDAFLQKQTAPWSLTDSGLRVKRGEWLWLTDPNLRENIRVVLEFTASGAEGGLDICINARRKPMKEWHGFPQGYGAQTVGTLNGMDQILKNETQSSAPEMIAASMERKSRPGENRHVIEFTRRNDRLTLKIDRMEISAVDLFPFAGREFASVGIRSFDSSIHIQNLQVYRLALPLKASPVVAGDSLVETRHFSDAIEKYLMIADDYVRGPVAEEALAKAYVTAASHVDDPQTRTQILIGIKRRLASRFTTFAYQTKILEIDALMLWKDGNYKSSLSIVNDILLRSPNSGIMKSILQQPHVKLPEYLLPEFMGLVARTRELTRLNLSNYGVRDLTPLAGMKLTYLDCSGNDLSALRGLEGMPLEYLDCSENHITSLEPLRGIPLKTLACQINQISDLSPLEASSLRDLNCAWNLIPGLEALRNFSLERFACRGNGIESLEPLRGMPLKRLDAGMNPVETLDPLRDLPLEWLRLDATPIVSLNPLSNMSLSLLSIANCSKIKDFSPLLTLRSLELIAIPDQIPESVLSRLREQPGLLIFNSEQDGRYSDTDGYLFRNPVKKP